MPTTVAIPLHSPAGSLAEARSSAMRSMAFCLSATAPPIAIFAAFNNPATGGQYWIRTGMGLLMILGSLLHLVFIDRKSIRFQAWWSLAWLTCVSTLTSAHLGPTIAGGLTWVLPMLVAVFFLGAGAGVAVVSAYALSAAASVALVQFGLIDPPRDLVGARELWTYSKIHFAGVLVLLLVLRIFWLLTRALDRALATMESEHADRLHAERARKQAEERMQANQHFEALGQLAGGVAHDFNNALTIIQCNAELLRAELSNSDLRARADDILAASSAAAQTTRQLLTLGGRAVSPPKCVSPGEAVARFGKVMSKLLPESVVLDFHVRDTRTVMTDPADLQQAVLNLVINARDAMPGGGRILVRSEDAQTADGGPAVSIAVADTGIGIAPDVLPRIFEPFFTTKPVGKGTGLGLAMVKGFVDRMNGAVSVQSTLGQGTTVTITLPACSLGRSESPSIVPAKERRTLRILLAEDEPALRVSAAATLSRGGHQVTACADVDEALSVLSQSSAFDLLCVDGVTGARPVSLLIDRFRETGPTRAVLICSGHPDLEPFANSLGRPGIDFLPKPYSGEVLLTRIDALAGGAAKSTVCALTPEQIGGH